MSYLEQGTSAFRKANVAFFAAGFNTFAILYCTQPLLAEFTKEFNISPTTASLALSGTTMSLAVSMLFFSSLSEKWGRKNVMFISMLTASLLSILTVFSSSFESLLVLRIIQGVALGGLPSIAMAYLGEEVAPQSLGVAMGLYISGNSLGAVAGRVITAISSDLFNWHVGLGIISIISLCGSIIFGITLPRSQHFQPSTLNSNKLAAVFMSHLKDPALLCLFGIGFLILASNIAMYNYVGYVLSGPPYHIPQALLAWIYLFFLVGMVSSIWMAKLAQKFGKSRALVISLVITMIGACLTLEPYLWFKIAGLPILTFGFFGSHSIASGWVSQRAVSNKAQASGLYLFFYYMGSSFGGTSVGEVWLWFGWGGVVSAIMVFLLLALLCTTLLMKRVKTTTVHSR
ncbi:MFS transporter [Paenibacillus kribbensis]|uniref:MFS transporter n=1 Tax=Paenibacillus kribbensis TaxID=172713 RepID=UPI0008399350|nr:MFS transporter [Paenibacillus kribbensis]